MIALVLLALGCGSGQDQACGEYRVQARVYGRCLVRRAETVATIDEALCDQAGSAQEDCRLRWVQTHDDLPVERLLAACTTDECRFVALDWQPTELAEQAARCEAHLGRLADPCKVHALDRYYGGRPSLEQQRSIAPTLAKLGWIGADQAGMAGACGIEVDCSIFGGDAGRCEERRAMGEQFRGCRAFRPEHPKPEPGY